MTKKLMIEVEARTDRDLVEAAEDALAALYSGQRAGDVTDGEARVRFAVDDGGTADCYDCESTGMNCLAHRTPEQRQRAGW